MAMIKCYKCGSEISEYSENCVYCGASVIKHNVNEANLINSQDISQTNLRKNGKNKKIGIIISIVAFIIISVIIFLVIKANTLTGYDKKAYEMILEASKSFKNPSSVRLVSGQFMWHTDYGKEAECEWLYCKLSATNGLGNRTSEDYDIYIDDDGKVVLNSYPLGPDAFYQTRDKLDIKKINRKLEAELGDY